MEKIFCLFRHQSAVSSLENERAALQTTVDAQTLQLNENEALLENLHQEVCSAQILYLASCLEHHDSVHLWHFFSTNAG
jgi:hypothetical protein